MSLTLAVLFSCATTSKSYDNSFVDNQVSYTPMEIPESIEIDDNSFRLLWKNNFDEHGDSWEIGDWIFDTNRCEFTEDMISIKDGLLRIGIRPVNTNETSRKEFWGGEYYNEKDSHQYGRWAVRMKPDVPTGVVASFFLSYYDFNDSFTALDEGFEIDIEFCGTTNEVELAIHWVDKDGELHHSDVPVIKLDSDVSENFHLWEIEVLPTHIRYYLDGRLIHEVTDREILDELDYPMGTRMNYWISDSKEWVGVLDKENLPITTYYDYAAFYEWVP